MTAWRYRRRKRLDKRVWNVELKTENRRTKQWIRKGIYHMEIEGRSLSGLYNANATRPVACQDTCLFVKELKEKGRGIAGGASFNGGLSEPYCHRIENVLWRKECARWDCHLTFRRVTAQITISVIGQIGRYGNFGDSSPYPESKHSAVEIVYHHSSSSNRYAHVVSAVSSHTCSPAPQVQSLSVILKPAGVAAILPLRSLHLVLRYR